MKKFIVLSVISIEKQKQRKNKISYIFEKTLALSINFGCLVVIMKNIL